MHSVMMVRRLFMPISYARYMPTCHGERSADTGLKLKRLTWFSVILTRHKPQFSVISKPAQARALRAHPRS